MKQIIFILSLLFASSSFSQKSSDPIWWKMEREGEYLKVANHLLYKVQSDTTRNTHADYLHIARNYGYLNDYDKAIFYLNKSMDGESEQKDELYWWYYKGTIAFFKRDKKTLEIYLKKLESNYTPFYENNYKTLKSLYLNFDKGYKEASSWNKV